MNGLKRNFLYNVIYQILILIIPLVTIPYISRILGSSGIGIYSYTYSIVYYFMIFAMLGLNNYGNRTIAKISDNKKELSEVFKEIYIMQAFISLVMILLYFVYLNFFSIKYKEIAIIQSLYIFSCLFDINWFFFGIEKFKTTITRNIIIKITSLILIFIFIKNKSDLWIYTLISGGSVLFSQIALWPFLRKYITNERINIKNIFKHFYPCIKLFLPVIAVAVYKVMDKTMIGCFSNVSEVGYYENAEKIINVPNVVITALGTIMLPRMSNLYSKNKINEIKRIIEKSIKFIMFLSFMMMYGLICISKNFSVLFFGNEFEKSGIIIMILSITILFLAWGNVIRTQYLIPKEYDKIYIKSAFIGALVNLILNIIFIPKFQSYGACIGTILAEFSVALYQTLSIRKELPITKYIKNSYQFFIKSSIVFFIIYPLNYININSMLKIIFQIIIAILIYYILNFKYVNDLLKIQMIRRNKYE